MNQQEAVQRNFVLAAAECAPDRESKNTLHEIYNQSHNAKIPVEKLVKPFAAVVGDGYSKESLGTCTTAVFGDKVPTALTHHVAAKGAPPAAKAEDDDLFDDDEAKKPAAKKPHPHKK